MMTVPLVASRRSPSASFSLIELLTVIAIIAILAALILTAGNGVITKSLRSRASAEIQAMSTALEGYKTDNGTYPLDNTLNTNTYTTVNVTTTGAGSYQVPAETLYQALSGQTNFNDNPLTAGKSYMSFRPNQLGNVSAAMGTTGAGSTTYVQDPWRYPYGYSTGTNTSYPYNGNGFFDLWSTGGKTGTTAANTNTWISNWTQ